MLQPFKFGKIHFICGPGVQNGWTEQAIRLNQTRLMKDDIDRLGYKKSNIGPLDQKTIKF